MTRLWTTSILFFQLFSTSSCWTAKQPAYGNIVTLEGTPYERGFQHGRILASRIRSLYTLLLETNLMPYLNREQSSVQGFLMSYDQPEYKGDQFSYKVLLESGQALLSELEENHPEFVEEMRGISDGSGVPFEQVLILNTFVDTMLAFRSVTFFIRQLQSPRIEEMEFLAELHDGVDNNGDTVVDEEDEGYVVSLRKGEREPKYEPKKSAVMVEVPTDSRIRLLFYDPPPIGSFGGASGISREQDNRDVQGMDPDSVRIQLNDVLYTSADPCISTRLYGDNQEYLEVVFDPPGGLQPARVVSLIVQAHNKSEIYDPPPLHPRVMRDEHMVFTTKGYGKSIEDIPNEGAWDGRSMPPAIGFAVRGSATPDGSTRLAHHFALLDSNVAHKHAVLFIHRPDQGRPFAVLGWSGLLGGFSGMSASGLACAVNPSDTLDNPLTGRVEQDSILAKLISHGTPVGVQLRLLLEHAASVQGALASMASEDSTFGWNYLLADESGDIEVVERDGNILEEVDNGFHSYGPAGNDVSAGPDDLHIAMHFNANVPDIGTKILIFDVQPQYYWSTFYYRSIRAGFMLSSAIEQRYGNLDSQGAIDVLRIPSLVDMRESMNAVVYQPDIGRIDYAIGKVPATDGEFETLYLEGER